MRVRPIKSTEVEQFAAIGPHSLGDDGFARYIRELWELGSSSPDRCFVVEDDGTMIARIVYRGTGDTVNFTGLHLPWHSEYPTIGHLLFQQSLPRLRLQGVETLQGFVTSAWSYADEVHTLLRSLGLRLFQTKTRYTWRGTLDQIAPSERLLLRSDQEVGEAVFLDLIERTSQSTLDALDRVEIEEMGATQHAQHYLTLLKTEFEYHPEWWLAAYNRDEAAIGHVIGIPYNLHQGEGAIGYIGILPEQRGNHYIDDVLRAGMRAMVQSGLTTIIADTDVQNTPMQRAFVRCDYARGDTTWVYQSLITNIINE